jgi:hypothetical protein
MEHQGSWDKNLPWTEFSYNNSYQESLKMARSKCCTDVDVTLHSTRFSLERRRNLDPTLLRRPEQRSVAFKTT